MILEGIDPPVKQPGVTWYVKKHYKKEVVDVDTKDEELAGKNIATNEERAFLQSIDKEEAEQKMGAKMASTNSN